MKVKKVPTALTACAGEHFVAYRISAMDYLVALTRSGSPSIDLMVATADGKKTVTIQVKTAKKAFFPPTKKHPGFWEWIIGSQKAKDLRGESVFYAFVDLKGGAGEPDVFIVPADFVASNLLGFPKPPKEATAFWFDIEEKDKDKWQEAWRLIRERLDSPNG
jgi:hypothetical protein